MQNIFALNRIEDGWLIPPNGYVYVEPKLISQLNEYRQVHTNSKESGGLLLGYFAERHLHVITATTPLPKDKQTRCRFYRRDPEHIEIAKHIYKKSKGLVNILGEWHTHPENIPLPSLVDLKQWKSIQKARLNLQSIFVIVGLQQWWVGTSLNDINSSNELGVND